jgi:hypothetical protein
MLLCPPQPGPSGGGSLVETRVAPLTVIPGDPQTFCFPSPIVGRSAGLEILVLKAKTFTGAAAGAPWKWSRDPAGHVGASLQRIDRHRGHSIVTDSKSQGEIRSQPHMEVRRMLEAAPEYLLGFLWAMIQFNGSHHSPIQLGLLTAQAFRKKGSDHQN